MEACIELRASNFQAWSKFCDALTRQVEAAKDGLMQSRPEDLTRAQGFAWGVTTLTTKIQNSQNLYDKLKKAQK